MRVLPRPIAGALPVRPFASYLGLVSRSPERHPGHDDSELDAQSAVQTETEK
jgi:hypothetical protein